MDFQTQEEKIIYILLNYMAIEGAKDLFGQKLPTDKKHLHAEIERMGYPKKWAGDDYYDETPLMIKTANTAEEKCYACLKLIRNNLFHANKAKVIDKRERLEELLNWSIKYIKSIYSSGSDFSQEALKIKKILRIEKY